MFAGTIGKTEQSGGLYRIDPDGRAELLWKGTGCANGMGFTPDLRRFYWTCSTSGVLYIADYERATGVLANRRVFYRAAPEEGTPDGLTVDRAGAVWTARWGGSAVLQLGADGRAMARIDLPVRSVSSVAFGGPRLDTLYITTAGGEVDDQAADGTLYRCQVETPGSVEFRSRILL